MQHIIQYSVKVDCVEISDRFTKEHLHAGMLDYFYVLSH